VESGTCAAYTILAQAFFVQIFRRESAAQTGPRNPLMWAYHSTGNKEALKRPITATESTSAVMSRDYRGSGEMAARVVVTVLSTRANYAARRGLAILEKGWQSDAITQAYSSFVCTKSTLFASPARLSSN
jgi:hypothetical protein